MPGNGQESNTRTISNLSADLHERGRQLPLTCTNAVASCRTGHPWVSGPSHPGTPSGYLTSGNAAGVRSEYTFERRSVSESRLVGGMFRMARQGRWRG